MGASNEKQSHYNSLFDNDVEMGGGNETQSSTISSNNEVEMGGGNENQSSTISSNNEEEMGGDNENQSPTSPSNNEVEGSQDTAWRDKKTAAECLSHLCLSKLHSDIVLTFENDDSITIPAHKVVLSMRSTFFADMINNSEGLRLMIEDVNPEIMKVVLSFIYTENAELSSNNAIACLHAAKKFQLDGLVQKCSDFLVKTLDAKNVCLRYNHAISNEIKNLEEKCLSFIMENATNVLFSPGFLELPQATLLNVLKQDKLGADELDIFKAAMKWAEKNCETNNIPKTGENMRDQLKEALFEIRFVIIPKQDLADVVAPSEILTKEEMGILYMYHALKRPAALSERFCKPKRTETSITIDLRHYDISELDHSNNQNKYALEIECEFYEMAYDESELSGDQDELIRNSKSLKLKSISGMFVKSVRQIVVSNTYVNDYEIDGNYINFQTPIEMCNGEIIQFTTDKHDTAKNLNGTSPMRFNIDQNGNVFTLVQFPAMTETITFLK